jgi:xylan 1,4-beta-xylosidase
MFIDAARAKTCMTAAPTRRLARFAAFCAMLASCGAAPSPAPSPTWTADNGNGTYTNPLFYDEFSDPDMIRVGDDFYLTGTTMHAMPGLPILHSRDMVNWDFVGYVLDTLDLGPAYRLEDGKSIYGQGIWAPSFRYHNGTFYIFSNVNHATTQMFTATSPKGPWTRTPMKRTFHDLSVLFDDDGKVYVVWGYQELHFAQLDASLTDIVPGSERIITQKGAGLGEGSHFYKFGKAYYITTAEYAGSFRMPAARAPSPLGPWEINPSISEHEDFGERKGYHLAGGKDVAHILPPDPKDRDHLSLHQGGIIQTPAGDWWGWSMFEGNSVGRLTALSPVTWKDGWPYFGLPGNLGRSPRTWVKPIASNAPPRAPYVRSDRFDGKLNAVWQWNHVPDPTHWSLSERPGALRLHTLPAAGFLAARNTLTQRAIGPQSTVTAELDASGLADGDVAGLALLNRPYAWLGVERSAKGLSIVRFDENGGRVAIVPVLGNHLWLRAACDFDSEQSRFSYSTDGRHYSDLEPDFTTVYQLMTFQGVRYGLFAFNQRGITGGHADFVDFDVHEGRPESRPAIPLGKTITLRPTGATQVPALLQSALRVQDRALGRVTLMRGASALTVSADGAVSLEPARPGPAQTFQWMESLSGGAVLMSLRTNRYLHVDAATGTLRADSTGPTADNADLSRFTAR